MIKSTALESILFLDVETVSAQPSYASLSPRMQALWDKKASYLQKNETDTPESLYSRAGIYAEFGKIVCISVAYIHSNKIRIKSFYGDDEKEILSDFATLLQQHYHKSHHRLCAHNGKEFDFPYLCRRMLVNGISIPFILDVAGKKPWETSFLDTMDLWRFGDYKNYTSLDLLAAIFDIDSPKNDIDGSMVSECYWKNKELERIKKYCEKDVITLIKIYLAYMGKRVPEDIQLEIEHLT
ncbi:MAG: 3'-5' exonuclease [Bacteroidales bacterium]|nr:3'-5' exonuclease [Bacteroidales bacterium]